MLFWGKKFLSPNLIEKKMLSMKRAEKNIMLELCALKNIVFVEKKFSAALRSKSFFFDSDKNHSHPPPLS